jgi:glycosyltransferase involved in cell wall biosynthesis/SAM-dependent methyltransferase
MKFVVEAAGLTVAGGKELALDLLTTLASHSEHQFVFIVPDLVDYRQISGTNIRKVVWLKSANLVWRDRLLNHEVPRICRDERADALLCLGNFPPRRTYCPTVVLLQNAWIVYNDTAAESRRTMREHLILAYGRRVYRHLPARTTIVTQTEVMKDHLCQRFGLAPQQVTVIPNTLSSTARGGSLERDPHSRRRGPGPFRFLCLAHYYVHKNLEVLVDALRLLPRYTEEAAECLLTIAPEQHVGARRLLARVRREVASIENLGPIASDKLSEAYGRADALIFPSLLESFTRTYLEAMHFGLPILTSDRDFAHCLCQDAAIYFDPLDPASVARGMARMMADAPLRRRLVANGSKVLALAPSWDEVAARFVGVLEAAARRELQAARVAEPQQATWRQAVSGSLSPRDAPQTSPVRREEVASAARRASPGPEGKGVRAKSPSADEVRVLFNNKAHSWACKYGANQILNSRVEQFTAQLSHLRRPPASILDFGCGTGQIAAAIAQMGYRVTACDFAEDMINVARNHHAPTPVEWVSLPPDWKVLPFEDGSFDGVVASSVFEYLGDVPGVAAELSRILRSGGVLLLTVPNPFNPVRKLEALLQTVLLCRRLAFLRGARRLKSYATYLRLSRNRLPAPRWRSVLGAARFVPLDERDFGEGMWRNQAAAPLILLTMRRSIPTA